MNTTSLMQGLGAIGLFPSRVFLPAFMTALLLRFGPDVPIIAHSGLLAHVQHHPTWFTHNITLIVLAALSILEIVAQKNPEARHLLQEFDSYLKSGLAFLTSLGVISTTDAAFANQTAHTASFIDYIVPMISALGTFKLSNVRRDVLLPLHEHVEGTHLDRLISWAEESWVVFGAFVLVIFPLLMLVLVAIAIGVVLLLRKRMAVLEERSRIACTHCGNLIYACAMACFSCRQPLEDPREVGWLGQSLPGPALNLKKHPYRLIEKRRCPLCATPLKSRAAHQTCAVCAQAVPGDEASTQAYVDYIGDRLPLILGVCFLFSLVPIIGLIAGAVYYRMELVLPFSQYLPFGRRFLLRWGIRLLFLVLVFFQLIPLLGGLVVPLMAFISYTAHRNAYQSLALAAPPSGLEIAAS